MGHWQQSTFVNGFEYFGERLRLEREARGWSQGKLAALAGLDRTYINGIEKGRRNPTLKTLVKIADALDIALGELLYF